MGSRKGWKNIFHLKKTLSNTKPMIRKTVCHSKIRKFESVTRTHFHPWKQMKQYEAWLFTHSLNIPEKKIMT